MPSLGCNTASHRGWWGFLPKVQPSVALHLNFLMHYWTCLPPCPLQVACWLISRSFGAHLQNWCRYSTSRCCNSTKLIHASAASPLMGEAQILSAKLPLALLSLRKGRCNILKQSFQLCSRQRLQKRLAHTDSHSATQNSLKRASLIAQNRQNVRTRTRSS